jgi:3-oxoacyl-[acyl-carrier protein] reductase
MAKTLATEVAPFGVTVNNIGPGPTMTDRSVHLAQIRAQNAGIPLEEELKRSAARIPRGRLAQPEEIAAVAAFFASNLAGHITGRSLVVDGGEAKAF